MPFPFTLPTTSSTSLATCFVSPSHPSLPVAASTHRAVVRDSLKRHKRLAPRERSGDLPNVGNSLVQYLPYVFALECGVRGVAAPGGAEVEAKVVQQGQQQRKPSAMLGQASQPSETGSQVPSGNPLADLTWRPTLTASALPTREPPRVSVASTTHELAFALSTLAMVRTLQARATLHPLYQTVGAFPEPEQRVAAISTATKLLLEASGIWDFVATRLESAPAQPVQQSCADVTPQVQRALSLLSLAEATVLAVLKDDPYPAAVARGRSADDREWMFKAPDLPRVRAHLLARLCLAAAEHAAQASALLLAAPKVDEPLTRYASDLRRTARAKACRFLGIDADLGGRTGEGIGWLRAAMAELGVEVKTTGGPIGDKKKPGLGTRLKKEWSERKEEKRVEEQDNWGADGGRAEELRVLEMLEEKWVKINDTMNTQLIPLPSTLLAQMPSGRDMYRPKPYVPPELDAAVLASTRAPPPEQSSHAQPGRIPMADGSSDEDVAASERPISRAPLPGSYPAPSASADSSRSTSQYY